MENIRICLLPLIVDSPDCNFNVGVFRFSSGSHAFFFRFSWLRYKPFVLSSKTDRRYVPVFHCRSRS